MPQPTPRKPAPKKHKTTWKPGKPLPAPSYPKVLAFGDLTTAPHFDGPKYDAKQDHARLTGQLRRVYDLMADGQARTLEEIYDELTPSGPITHTGISSRLRDLRKAKFGGYTVESGRRGGVGGLFEYWLVL